MEIETQVAQMMGRAHTKAPESSEPGEGEDKTYLLFTTGSLTYSPHQIGKIPQYPRNIRETLHSGVTSPLMMSSLPVTRY